jgi:heptaprenyl diphosphate synthase
MPALLFNPSTAGRIIQFLLFWALAVLAGKKNNALATILVILGITAFNLLVPYGRVLFSLGAFKISSGALLSGLRRGVTLEGLFMLSRLTIRRDLRLPGAFGELVGESFRILSLITEKKSAFALPDKKAAPELSAAFSLRRRFKNIITGIDDLMLELDAAETAGDAPLTGGNEKKHSSLPGIAILAAAVIAAWLPWLFFRNDSFFF